VPRISSVGKASAIIPYLRQPDRAEEYLGGEGDMGDQMSKKLIEIRGIEIIAEQVSTERPVR